MTSEFVGMSQTGRDRVRAVAARAGVSEHQARAILDANTALLQGDPIGTIRAQGGVVAIRVDLGGVHAWAMTNIATGEIWRDVTADPHDWPTESTITVPEPEPEVEPGPSPEPGQAPGAGVRRS